MQWLYIIAVALVPSFAFAAPAFEEDLHVRDAGNIHICTDINFQGTCLDIFGGLGSNWTANCQELPDAFIHSIGSAVPDHGALCRLYDSAHSGCTGSGLSILEYPGDSDLFTSAAGIDAGHSAEYISCVTCTDC
ncbi:uncharacterized protein BCR38DRAFT_398690 [Pseudomassariella vexata]|uniref:Uncharacterized protein n=1 Tax=Pseudomassariella vexata TaxID=1141098 RepID=A0A1Y2DK81_9PEZI|nr:uncharacterized protein BCR38DRAFT_398690 [Pseudomassariella vexata]ORY59536.1 hypothetical protein BCR38DRAFT_398690 [Pseudomassariella vexata]